MTDLLSNPATSQAVYETPEFKLAVDKGINEMLDNYRRYVGGTLQEFEMLFVVDDPLHYCQLVALREEFGIPHGEYPEVFETAEGAKLHVTYWRPSDETNPDEEPEITTVVYSTSDRFQKKFWT